VHTLEDRKQDKRSRTNVVDEDKRPRPQGHVDEQLDEDNRHKW
jgi:hypothetical protein